MLKYRNHYKSRTTTKASAPQDRKIEFSDINFDKEKLRKLLATQRKPKNRRYYHVYSDDGVESDDEFSGSSDKEIAKKKKNT